MENSSTHPDASQEAVTVLQAKPENIKLVVIGYFLSGLLFNWLGLIAFGLWLKFKVKTNKKPKFIALAIGFGLFLLSNYFIEPVFIAPRLENSLRTQFPEMFAVKEGVEKEFPNETVGVNESENTSYDHGSAKTTLTFTVQCSSRHKLTDNEIRKIAVTACTTLAAAGKPYDLVNVTDVQSLLPFDIPLVHVTSANTTSHTCDQWNEQ